MPWSPMGAQGLCPVLFACCNYHTLWLLSCPMTLALTKGMTHCVGLQADSLHSYLAQQVLSLTLSPAPVLSPLYLLSRDIFSHKLLIQPSKGCFTTQPITRLLDLLLQDSWIYCCCLHAYGMSLHLCTHRSLPAEMFGFLQYILLRAFSRCLYTTCIQVTDLASGDCEA